MYLYNATIIAERDIGEAVRIYLAHQLESVAKGLKTGLFFLEMLDSPHEGVTYCIQLRTENEHEITRFQETHLTAIRTQLQTIYSGKVLFFDSIMKYLNP